MPARVPLGVMVGARCVGVSAGTRRHLRRREVACAVVVQSAVVAGMACEARCRGLQSRGIACACGVRFGLGGDSLLGLQPKRLHLMERDVAD